LRNDNGLTISRQNLPQYLPPIELADNSRQISRELTSPRSLQLQITQGM
jgi:hypothetical protein